MDVSRSDIAAWIVHQGLFDVTLETKIKACGRMVGDALAKINHAGTDTRKYIAYQGLRIDPETGKEEQKWLWVDTFEATAFQAHAGARASHKGIGKDVASLAALIASMNENNPNLAGNPIELKWDFSDTANGGNEDDAATPVKPR